MEGGNGVSEANGITQFAEGEPKRLAIGNIMVKRFASITMHYALCTMH